MMILNNNFMKNPIVILLVLMVLIQNMDIVSGELRVGYRERDYLVYRVSGSIWVKASINNVTRTSGSSLFSNLEYNSHYFYTKHYIYEFTNVGIVNYFNKSYIYLRGTRFVSNIELHYVSESKYSTPPDIVVNKSVDYIDIITYMCGRLSDLSIIRIDDLHYRSDFRLILFRKPSDLLNIPSGQVQSYSDTCSINRILDYLSNNLLVIVDPGYSNDFILRNDLLFGGFSTNNYVFSKYDILLRYFNGVLIYGLITVYVNSTLTITTSLESALIESTVDSKKLYSIEIELIETSVSQLPTWRSLRIDLTYLMKTGNLLEYGLIVLFVLIGFILTLYILYRKLIKTTKRYGQFIK